MIDSIFEDGIPAIFWNSTYWVKFRLKVGNYINFLEFLIEHQISFLAEVTIDFTNIPLSLHGKGVSKNLTEYFANNNNNTILIINFLNYYITSIVDFRYSTGKKLNYSFISSSTWQSTTFSAKSYYVPTTTTSSTTTTTTTFHPTTTMVPLEFFEILGQLYNLS